MKHFLTSDLKIVLVRLIQSILFAIPLGIFLIIYRDTFFTQDTAVGITGLGIMAIIIWALCLGKVFGKLPKILYFVIIFALFTILSYLGDFLKQIGCVVLIGACLALPLNRIVRALELQGETGLVEEQKHKYREKIAKSKEKEVEIEVRD